MGKRNNKKSKLPRQANSVDKKKPQPYVPPAEEPLTKEEESAIEAALEESKEQVMPETVDFSPFAASTNPLLKKLGNSPPRKNKTASLDISSPAKSEKSDQSGGTHKRISSVLSQAIEASIA